MVLPGQSSHTRTFLGTALWSLCLHLAGRAQAQDRPWAVQLAATNSTGTASGQGGTSYRVDGFDRVLSANGRYVVFESCSDDLVAGDRNGWTDVFRADRVRGITSLVSVLASGAGSGPNISERPAISANGRVVAFQSGVPGLIDPPLDHVDFFQIYARDFVLGITLPVTVNFEGTAGARGHHFPPAVDADGRMVVFASLASDLVPNDTNGVADIFARDLVRGVTLLVSADQTGTRSGNAGSFDPKISADGNFVAFASNASDLVEYDGNGAPDIFLRDLRYGITTLVSHSRTASANGQSLTPVISSNGRWVAFASLASDLAPGDTNNRQDVFLFDRATRGVALLSWNQFQTGPGNGGAADPSISADGRSVAYSSTSTNVVAGDRNSNSDIFFRTVPLSLVGGQTYLASVNRSGTGTGNGESNFPVLSGDGKTVAFVSTATDLALLDVDDGHDVFVHDLRTRDTSLVSLNSAGAASTSLSATDPALSLQGGTLTFLAEADDLSTLDRNSAWDVYVATKAPRVNFGQSAFWVSESGRLAEVLVRLSGPSSSTIEVAYGTSAGKAKPGVDYEETSGTLVFLPGEESKTFLVKILDDKDYEGVETVGLFLRNPKQAELGDLSVSTLVIEDNESAPPSRFSALPGDFYPAGTSGLASAEMGSIRMEAARRPDGELALLGVDDSDGDAQLELIVPWSGADAAPPATIRLSGACDRPLAALRLEITFLSKAGAVEWTALDPEGAPVDVQAAGDPGSLTTVTLEGLEEGIDSVQIRGDSVLIARFAWVCAVPAVQRELRCFRPADLYSVPTEDLGSISFPGMEARASSGPGGEVLSLSVRAFPDDLSVGAVLWISESDPGFPAVISFGETCIHSTPVRVEVEFHAVSPESTWIAFDAVGQVAAKKLVSSTDGLERVVLSSPAGIRKVTVVGDGISIREICWRCGPRQFQAACAAPGDFYPEGADSLAAANLGAARVEAAREPNGSLRPLQIVDWDADGAMDLWIPWSEEPASPPATIQFPGANRAALVAVAVEIIFRGGAGRVIWQAHDFHGELVDLAAVDPSPMDATVILESPSRGIARVEVLGSALRIVGICWEWGSPSALEKDPCESPARRFKEPGLSLEQAVLGSVKVDSARLTTGEPLPLMTKDCGGDGIIDLAIPWAGQATANPARIDLSAVCGGQLPVTATLYLWSDGAVARALDRNGGAVGVASAPTGYSLQALQLSSVQGVAAITLDSADACLAGLCWTCPPAFPRVGFRRGDVNANGDLDIADAVSTLLHLFSVGIAVGCADAADFNDDGALDLSDPIATLNFLFRGGPPPAGGFECQIDSPGDLLDCASPGSCE